MSSWETVAVKAAIPAEVADRSLALEQMTTATMPSNSPLSLTGKVVAAFGRLGRRVGSTLEERPWRELVARNAEPNADTTRRIKLEHNESTWC